MTLTQINSLLAVLDYGGFTEASKRLFMTQSAVSQAIAALEQELGVNILLRDRHKAIQLTTAGHRIVHHLRAINREVNAVKEIAEQEKQNPQRTLRLGCFPSVCACILPAVIRYFEIHHPNIKIIPFEENSTAIIDSLQNESIDAGFVHFPVSGMYSVPIYQDKFTVVLPPNHALAKNSTITVEELMGEPLIISKGRYELSIMALFKEKNITPQIKYEFNHPDTAISFIRQGLGIALLPELTLKTIADELCSVPLEPTFYRQISLLAKEKPVEGSPLFLLQMCTEQLVVSGKI
ncbi:LysR family transcriptional regulator [Escherichia coli]|uniref:LysR family transcriptional regulator n=1 Tax=Escherichia coli TaxID=562 RepID=UPI000986972F|nr:LysR family transcriptional regulator [Escherichia coli]OOI50571.1 transcriptional regulator [Escherichia coli]HAO1477111.1 LysR family transcriptional regulator [Escherichia coli]HAO1497543.1 LysR family transcriptional regulator [Escherichia coli]HAW0276099.1 LysR family transcriptional regulator [Escherichia coli]HCJ6078711.1 LysR family transcriptional regulator [Escherichia coli]